MARASLRDDRANPSPSPENSISDKENSQQSRHKRGATRSMAVPSASSKRQRLANRAPNIQGGGGSQVPQSQADPDKKYYDPDQDEAERRWLRKGLRDLTRDLHGNELHTFRDDCCFRGCYLTIPSCRFS